MLARLPLPQSKHILHNLSQCITEECHGNNVRTRSWWSQTSHQHFCLEVQCHTSKTMYWQARAIRSTWGIPFLPQHHLQLQYIDSPCLQKTTNAESKPADFCVIDQHIMLDQDYGAKFEHFAGDWCQQTHLLLRNDWQVPKGVLAENHSTNKLNPNTNDNFQLAMTLFKVEQEKKENLQEILGNATYKDCFGINTFGEFQAQIVDGKIIITLSLQHRVIHWYHTNLLHPGAMRTIN